MGGVPPTLHTSMGVLPSLYLSNISLIYSVYIPDHNCHSSPMASQSLTLLHMSLAAQDPYWLSPAYGGYSFPLWSHSSNVAPAPLQSGCRFYSTIFMFYSKQPWKRLQQKDLKKFLTTENSRFSIVETKWNFLSALVQGAKIRFRRSDLKLKRKKDSSSVSKTHWIEDLLKGKLEL